jgi:outer membrane protein assembly factor BamB
MAHFRLAILSMLALASAALAQQPRPEDSIDSIHLNEANQLGTRFRNAEARAAQGQWSEAIEEYQRILLENGDGLAPVDKHHVVQARWLAQARLSALPPEALTLYRSRIDPPAKKLLDQARASRDTAILHRIVDETFCCSYTDQALDLLGDIAFERGEFEEAEQLWRTIVRPATQPAAQAIGLVVANPKLNVASIRAKQLLAQLFQGETDTLATELQAFAKAHPDARGKLAGKQGLYVDILTSLANQPRELGTPLSPEGWTHFAGDAQRNRVLRKVEGRLAHLPCTEGPAWQVRLADGQKLSRPLEPVPGDKILSWTEAARSLGYYPVIQGDRVFVANGYDVKGYQLGTGAPVFKYELDSSRENLLAAKGQSDPDVSFPLAIAGEYIFARLGSIASGPPRPQRFGGGFRRRFNNFEPQPANPPATYLVCLSTQAKRLQRDVWIKTPPSPGEQGATVAFEGAPIVHQNRVYIAATQFPSGQTRSLIVSYEADTGNLRWQREVCTTGELKDGDKRSRHHLLTLAGPNIIYCSHSGAITAVDAVTGQVRWGVRYATRGPKMSDGQPSPRGLVPCCYADGRVYAAPLDYDRVLCLDSRTGQTIWESDPMEIIHMLGVSHGKLFCSTLTPRRGLRALDAATGAATRGWFQPADGSNLPTFGRGLLAGDLVFWPTRDGLHVLRQSDGEPVAFDPDIRGNLAASDGCLVTADARVLSAYLPDRWSLHRRTQEAGQDGASATTHYRLGLAQLDAGLLDQARQSFETAWKLGDEPGIRKLARGKLHEALLQMGQLAAEKSNWETMEDALRQASIDRFEPAERVRALAQLGTRAAQGIQVSRAIAAWQTILETPELRAAPLAGPGAIPERPGILAVQQIDRLLERHGRAAYAAVEARAVQVARTAGRSASTRLEREYPQALATLAALEARAARAEKEDRPWETAAACRSMLAIPRTSTNRLKLLAQLARAYERENCLDAARKALEQLEKEGGSQREVTIEPTLTIGAWVQARRRQLGPDVQRSSGQEGFYSRQWQKPGDDFSRGLLSQSGAWLFRSAEAKLDCMSAADGKVRWTRKLPFAPSWTRVVSDRLILGGNHALLCVRQGDGVTCWEQTFERDGATEPQSFQIAGETLYFLLGRTRFCAWEIDRGSCLWSAWAPGSRLGLAGPDGAFGPRTLVTEATCLLTTGQGRPLLLERRSGKRLPAEWGSQQEIESISTDSTGKLALMVGREMLQTVDMRTGQPGWAHYFQASQALSGEQPQVLCRGERIFVQVPYNYGYLLECLNAQTGEPQWPDTLAGSRPLDLELGDADDRAVYCSGPTGIEARALADGRRLWKQRGGSDACRQSVHVRGAELVSFPQTSQVLGWEIAWHGLTLRWPCALSRTASADYCVAEVIDARTGQLLQALNVAAPFDGSAGARWQRSNYSPTPSARLVRRSATEFSLISDRLLAVNRLATTVFQTQFEAGVQSAGGTP